MALQGNHMGRLGAMASGRVPFDAKVAPIYAEWLGRLINASPGSSLPV